MASSILAVRALLEVLEDCDIGRKEFFRAAGFDPTRLAQQDGRIELEELDGLLEIALNLSGKDSLGLRMGELTSATTFPLAAHLVAHATTLRDGIDALLRFHALLTDRRLWELREEGRTATLVCNVAAGSLRCRRFRCELTMVGFHRMLTHFERIARPQRVAFDYSAPDYRGEYRRVFGGVERFNQPFNGIVFDRRLLSVVQLHQDPEFHAALRVQAEKRVSRLTQSITYAERVREYVLVSAPADRRNMGVIAHNLGMSARSLRRRLQEEGVSYVEVTEGALAMLAKRLILDERRSIEATAYAMGYSVPAAFHRAFKRWTGSTPAAFRAKGHGR
jgi:AraC-like DNA-binding protein